MMSKDHGFGTGPGTRGAPAVFVPPVICIVYRVHWFRATYWIWSRAPASQVWLSSRAVGVSTYVTELGSIASLNAMRISCVWATSVSPLAGTVLMMYGFAQTVMNLKGFTTVESIGFGISVFPSRSVAETVTVYTVHPVNWPVWVILRTVSPVDHASD